MYDNDMIMDHQNISNVYLMNSIFMLLNHGKAENRNKVLVVLGLK